MRYPEYHAAFTRLYPNYGAPPLMEEFGITRGKATRIAHFLGIQRLPRDERTCWACPAGLAGVPTYTGNYCSPCFNALRKRQAEAPKHYIRALFHRAKNRAKEKGYEFDLTQKHLLMLWVKQGHKCFYSGVEMSTTGRQRDPYGVSLDRVFPDQGYTKANVVLCCWGVNTAKQEFTLAEFLHLCRAVAQNPRLDTAIKSFCGACPETGQGSSES